ncbi:MAG: hypothetical protein R3228_09195 [Halioglobus sp.]|nr:hypothetical protein [Halioglobus sp.]
MSLGTWDPNADAAAGNASIDTPTLQQLMDYSRSDLLASLPEHLAGDESQRLSGLMHIDHGDWTATAEALTDDDIRHLIRFFAVAENLPGWEAGERSPVIPLARVLRQRGQRLEREFLLWLREVSDNRFLPYGPL